MTANRTAILALAAAGALWGLTVPLSKLSLDWLGGGWLTVRRFSLAAPLLAYAGRRGLRAALTPRIAAAGAIGFGAVILLQNAGIERTSVSHAALVVGAVPVMVALMAAGLGHGVARPTAWAGYGLALAGIAMVAGGGGAGATVAGDLLVFASVALSATFIVLQPRLLAGRDPAAVTAVQFGAGALVALPHAARLRGPARRAGDRRARGGAGGARVRRHAAAVLALRLRPGARPRRPRGRLPQPRAARRRRRRLGRLRRGGRGDPARSAAVAVLAGIALSTMPARDRDTATTLATRCTGSTPRRLVG